MCTEILDSMIQMTSEKSPFVIIETSSIRRRQFQNRIKTIPVYYKLMFAMCSSRLHFLPSCVNLWAQCHSFAV